MTDTTNVDTIIDGSYCEGGGQILRNTCALSHILNKPIVVNEIRKGRTVPGLKNQHLTGILFMKNFGHDIVGAQLKSTELTIRPKARLDTLEPKLVADTKSAGSCTLLAQMLLPVFLFPRDQSFSESTVLELIGGTNVDFSPPIDTYIHLFAPLVQKSFNISFDIELVRRGFFPKGGGTIRLSQVQINDKNNGLTPLTLVERGDVIAGVDVKILYTHNDCKSYASDVQSTMSKTLERSQIFTGVNQNIEIELESNKSHRNERSVVVVASFSTSAECKFLYSVSTTVNNPNPTARNNKRKKQRLAGDIVKEVVEFLEKQWNEGGCVCEYTQDQMIIFMALANGTSQLRTGPLTDHTKTAIHFCRMMAGAEFTVDESDNGSVLITCKGIGFR